MTTGFSDVGLIVLSGGKSSRMGEDKAFLALGELTLIEWIIKKGREAGINEIVIVANNIEKFKNLNGKVVKDFFPGQGPLAGIHSGLVHSRLYNNIVVPCDMPFVAMDIFHKLLEKQKDCQVVVPMMDGKYQPLTAIYTKNCIPYIEQLLTNSITKVIKLYELVETCYVELTEDVSFFNINTPEDFVIAQGIIKDDGVGKGD